MEDVLLVDVLETGDQNYLNKPGHDVLLLRGLLDSLLLLLDDHGQVACVSELHDDLDPLLVEAVLDDVKYVSS